MPRTIAGGRLCYSACVALGEESLNVETRDIERHFAHLGEMEISTISPPITVNLDKTGFEALKPGRQQSPGQWKKSTNKLESRPRKASNEKYKIPRHGAVSVASLIQSILSGKSKDFIMVTGTKVTDRAALVFSTRGCLIAHRNGGLTIRLLPVSPGTISRVSIPPRSSCSRVRFSHDLFWMTIRILSYCS
jgi:hypothetical protein